MHICAASATVLWALGYVMTRVAVRHFTPEAMAFLRYFVAAAAMLIFAFIKRLRLPAKRDIPLFILGGAAGFAVYVYALNMGARTLTASVVSFIVSSAPIITALLARIFLRERMGLAGWIAVIAAFSGVGVITSAGSKGLSLDTGAAWICLSAILISVYNVYQKKLLLRYTPLEITTYCITAGALLLSVFAPRAFPQLASAPPFELAAILILGVFSAAGAYACWAYALSKAEKTSDVTSYMFLTPIITTFMGFIIINEAPDVYTYLGGFMVVCGVLLVNNRNWIFKHEI
ncbi:MAG: DMT family transporter [Oscillospiraceae bacterium]|nr:DMT family transporter [Oscillospiraceae bacterium]